MAIDSIFSLLFDWVHTLEINFNIAIWIINSEDSVSPPKLHKFSVIHVALQFFFWAKKKMQLIELNKIQNNWTSNYN